ELDVTTLGNIRFVGSGVVVRANAAIDQDGDAGAISIDSSDGYPNALGPIEGDVELDGIYTLLSGTTGGSGGSFDVSAGRDLTFTGSVDASGTDTGGQILWDAGRTFTLNGVITAQGTSAEGDPGGVDLSAGLATDQNQRGNLLIQRNIFAGGGS